MKIYAHGGNSLPWVLTAALAGSSLLVALPVLAAPIGLSLAGPDGAGEYNLTWPTGTLEQVSALRQSWTNVGTMETNYHIAPANDLGHNRFYRVRGGQNFSTNIVGYINVRVPKGFSLIANQLNAKPDNTLESVLPHPPENTTLYFYNGKSYNSFNFSADNPGWFPPHKVLGPGDGAFISIEPSQAPFGTNITLVGEVQLVSTTLVTNGFSIISSALPISDTLDPGGELGSGLAFPTRENDTVYRFDPALFAGRGGYRSYNYSGDAQGWVPGQFTPALGESFFLSADPSYGTNRFWRQTFTVGPP